MTVFQRRNLQICKCPSGILTGCLNHVEVHNWCGCDANIEPGELCKSIGFQTFGSGDCGTKEAEAGTCSATVAGGSVTRHSDYFLLIRDFG